MKTLDNYHTFMKVIKILWEKHDNILRFFVISLQFSVNAKSKPYFLLLLIYFSATIIISLLSGVNLSPLNEP